MQQGQDATCTASLKQKEMSRTVCWAFLPFSRVKTVTRFCCESVFQPRCNAINTCHFFWTLSICLSSSNGSPTFGPRLCLCYIVPAEGHKSTDPLALRYFLCHRSVQDVNPCGKRGQECFPLAGCSTQWQGRMGGGWLMVPWRALITGEAHKAVGVTLSASGCRAPLTFFPSP